jgi:hypothetical protein
VPTSNPSRSYAAPPAQTGNRRSSGTTRPPVRPRCQTPATGRRPSASQIPERDRTATPQAQVASTAVDAQIQAAPTRPRMWPPRTRGTAEPPAGAVVNQVARTILEILLRPRSLVHRSAGHQPSRLVRRFASPSRSSFQSFLVISVAAPEFRPSSSFRCRSSRASARCSRRIRSRI